MRSDIGMLEGKQADYASSHDPWLNFREAADFTNRTRGITINALDVAYVLLGVKISRLQNLGSRVPSNESIAETLRDLRGYSAIIEAMQEELSS